MAGQKSVNPEIIKKFVDRLARLDAGDLARLKQNSGNSLAEANSSALSVFYRILPRRVPRWQEEVYFLVATLYHLTKAGKTGNIGQALRLAQTAHNKNGLDRRMELLLDADMAQMPARLHEIVHLLASQRVSVEWELLLRDLLYWRNSTHYTQRDWARAYFG